MSVQKQIRDRIKEQKQVYNSLRKGKESLLVMIDEAELPESVYNSNAIENSTLTLDETEKILLEQEVAREVSVREVFEAKNLARVMEYIRGRADRTEIDEELILFSHRMLLTGIDDQIAGRFRQKGEYVRVGTHVAPGPEKVKAMIQDTLIRYASDLSGYFIDQIARFHLDFEIIHPFVDGNGRIGRVLMNYQLLRLNFPAIIIRDKEKQEYYSAIKKYQNTDDTSDMEKIIALGLLESLHKRNVYLRGDEIVKVSDFAKQSKRSIQSLLNAARRQTIPAFREKGMWKIGRGS